MSPSLPRFALLSLSLALILACTGGADPVAPGPELTASRAPDLTAAPAPAGIDPVGTWTEATEMAMVYDGPEACAADQGTWRADEGCMFQGSNTARFGPRTTVDGADAWPVTVETMGGNAHTCVFEGIARREGDQLVATAPGMVYEGAEPEAKDCRVTFRFGPGGLDVDAQDVACQHFCGVRAQIYMRGAKK